jgi:ABC-type antimicrobial peptide transport system permease subunit
VAPKQFHVLVKVTNTAVDNRVALRAAAFAVDRDLPLNNLQAFDRYLSALSIALASLVPIFSVIASITAVLAASGLFGLISRSVIQRTQEMGVRRALGATRWQVTAVFLRQGAIYLCVGVIGIGLGIMVTKLLSALIPSILVHVVSVTTAVFVFMALVILTASYLPTRKAVALEPGDALSYE